MTVYILATRPYPEKASFGIFFLDVDSAKRELERMPEGIRESYHVYEATIEIKPEPVL